MTFIEHILCAGQHANRFPDFVYCSQQPKKKAKIICTISTLETSKLKSKQVKYLPSPHNQGMMHLQHKPGLLDTERSNEQLSYCIYTCFKTHTTPPPQILKCSGIISKDIFN